MLEPNMLEAGAPLLLAGAPPKMFWAGLAASPVWELPNNEPGVLGCGVAAWKLNRGAPLLLEAPNLGVSWLLEPNWNDVAGVVDGWLLDAAKGLFTTAPFVDPKVNEPPWEPPLAAGFSG